MTQSDVQAFFDRWNNKYNNFDGAYGPQCKDVFSQFNHDLVTKTYIVGNPIVMWRNYDKLATLKRFYEKIPNDAWWKAPKMGDVMIFDIGATGHISICTNAVNWLWFTSFDQNYPLGSKCHYVAHNYLRPKVLGWFRPKNLV